MRMRVNRLVYVLIGVALAVGLLVSTVVRPETRLTGSEDCYGSCHHSQQRWPSVTDLWLSSSTVTYRHEQVETFSVKVSSGVRSAGVPTGYVVVESRGNILCSVYLHRGKGSCSPARALPPGWYEIVAYYSGDKYFKPSTSNMETLHVLGH
jgi:Bacterial Ig-like domain (group 3)